MEHKSPVEPSDLTALDEQKSPMEQLNERAHHGSSGRVMRNTLNQPTTKVSKGAR